MGAIKTGTAQPIMRLLHIGLMVNGRKEGLSAAFIKHFGEDYKEMGISEHIPQAIGEFKADIVFLQIQNDRIGHATTYDLLKGPLQKLKAGGAFIINWTGDIRNGVPPWMDRFKELVDITCFSNQRDIDAFNGPAAFLQIGFDPEVFKRWDDPREAQVHDVVFMGNNYGNQFPLGHFRTQMLSQLNGFNVGVYGNYKGAIRSLNADGANPFPMQSLESKTYNRCKIALSISHYDAERYTSDRLFRCLGSGPMVIAKNYKGLDLDFNIRMPGRHLVTFDTIPELQSLLNYYLSDENEPERKAIADAGYSWVHENCTYDNMVKNIASLHLKQLK